MNKLPEQLLIFAPQPNATSDEVMQILKLVLFQLYPEELRTQEQLTKLYNELPESAKRHFQIRNP
jgi:hypothetical protein